MVSYCCLTVCSLCFRSCFCCLSCRRGCCLWCCYSILFDCYCCTCSLLPACVMPLLSLSLLLLHELSSGLYAWLLLHSVSLLLLSVFCKDIWYRRYQKQFVSIIISKHSFYNIATRKKLTVASCGVFAAAVTHVCYYKIKKRICTWWEMKETAKERKVRYGRQKLPFNHYHTFYSISKWKTYWSFLCCLCGSYPCVYYNEIK